jgi:hypothetical protein
MHPEDLYRALVEKGARLDASDWKYGWPHKWYVEDLPSPLAGERVCVGTTTRRNAQGVIASEPNWGVEGATTHAKFYNVHLLDDGFNAAARDALVRVIWKHTGIFFEIEQDKFRWIRRPYEESNAR